MQLASWSRKTITGDVKKKKKKNGGEGHAGSRDYYCCGEVVWLVESQPHELGGAASKNEHLGP